MDALEVVVIVVAAAAVLPAAASAAGLFGRGARDRPLTMERERS